MFHHHLLAWEILPLLQHPLSQDYPDPLHPAESCMGVLVKRILFQVNQLKVWMFFYSIIINISDEVILSVDIRDALNL